MGAELGEEDERNRSVPRKKAGGYIQRGRNCGAIEM